MASALAHELNQPLLAIVGYMKGSRRLLESGGEDRSALLREDGSCATISPRFSA
jgi:two-component system, LuxR family, sensor kinase FixL